MTVRVKLALLYGIMFLAGAVALVGLSYQLVARNLPERTVVAASGNDVVLRANKLLKTPGLSASDRSVLSQIVAEPPDKALAVAQAVAGDLSPATASHSCRRSPPRFAAGRCINCSSNPRSRSASSPSRRSSSVGSWPDASWAPHTYHRHRGAALGVDLDERIDVHGPDDELTRLANTLDAMLDRLAASFEGQRRFVASASHELRTPLTIMAAELDVTLARPDASLADLRRVGATVRSAVDRSDRLVTSLLALA